MPNPTPTPWSYTLIRLLFRFVLKIFYATIVVENAEVIPPTGVPCIVCANHSNSLTDALLLVVSIPKRQRGLLRLTAKATQFGHRTFTSWLIESAGTVPIQRRQDSINGQVDNVVVMQKLVEALESGDAVCVFPEGRSRYHPTMGPMKTGVARLVSDVLTRNQDTLDFKICIQPCSVTYMHRQHFRSDVLVTFQPPIILSGNPELIAPVEFEDIRNLTATLHKSISSGTFDSPTWDLIRTSKLCGRIYVPLGTGMILGDYVRVVRAFLEAFKNASEGSPTQLLCKDIKAYQDRLAKYGVKDDRIRLPLPRRLILYRLMIRVFWASFLALLSLPGLILWTPVFLVTFYAVHNFKKTGPIFDTWDEIAQYKLTYGLFSGIMVWGFVVLLTFPTALITAPLIPAIMWMSLRWAEDTISAFRASNALLHLLLMGKETTRSLNETRADLHSRIMNLAEEISLPSDPEAFFASRGGRQKGRVRGEWEAKRKYFSLTRRRKRDWNETLRLYDQVDYPAEDI